MVLKAAWTSAAEHVHTTGSVCRCRTSERNWGPRAEGKPRLPPTHLPATRQPSGIHSVPGWPDPRPSTLQRGRPAPPHLPLPVGGVDKNDVFGELVVRDEDVV